MNKNNQENNTYTQDQDNYNEQSSNYGFPVFNNDKRPRLYASIAVNVVLAFFVLLMLVILIVTKSSSNGEGFVSNAIKNIDTIVEDKFYFDSDKKKQDKYALKAYVAGLGDKYSDYLTKEEIEQQQKNDNGIYVGIGISFTYDFDKRHYVIAEVYKGYGGEEANIKSGDILLAINEKEMTLDESANIIAEIKKFKPNTIIKVKINQDGIEKKVDVKLKKVEVPRVKSEIIDNALYIRLVEFEGDMYKQLMQEYSKYDKGSYKAIILDERNNPGGSVQKLSDITSAFISQKKLFTMVDKAGNVSTTNSKEKSTINEPVYLLVNGQSASSSEILAAIFKDYERATIIGQKTFGKGIVQGFTHLENGDYLKLTIGEVFSPYGKKIHGVGVIPNIEVEPVKDSNKLPLKEQPEVKKALEIINSK